MILAIIADHYLIFGMLFMQLRGFLRAMVVHPVFAKDKATALAVKYYADLQTDDGAWGNDFARN